ncbi:MAG: chromate efflux transporter [Eubacteriales bacterium]|nr:chromate efflux transporter [Eubacteriales bacterium]MDD4711628.1 chromate efflux transporter [Eubacteriales bacterium]
MLTEHAYTELNDEEKRRRLKEIAAVFLRLGALAFGGPAAHIAMMDEEIVQKKKWLGREHFIDLIGATNLIPGPNSTELAIHIGFIRGGTAGLFIAGAAFIIPAMLIVLTFAVLYTRFDGIPEVSGVLYGIKPVIIAIVLHAIYRLAKAIIRGWLPATLTVSVIALAFLGAENILLLAVAGLVSMVAKNYGKTKNALFAAAALPIALGEADELANAAKPAGIALHSVFLAFMKIGSVLYGSGYVLLAFLETEFVKGFAVISNQQLLDAVAIGQFTPGPVFTTATFIGYLISGFPGALAATAGIFLPSFLLVLLLNPLIPKLRKSTWVAGALDGINAASLGLMSVVTVKLGIDSLRDPLAAGLFTVAFVLMSKFKFNSAWAILAGGVVGFVYHYVMM